MFLVSVFAEVLVLIQFCVFIFRRLSTLNKCAVMRIGTPAKKMVCIFHQIPRSTAQTL